MTIDTIAQALSAPTPAAEVGFFPKKIVGGNTDRPKALCVPYIQRQFVEDRLDSVVGPFNWQTDVRTEAGVLVYGIGIRPPDEDEFIWKWDTGADDVEGKANETVTYGIKRAGRLWGIGRDVSRLSAKWRACKIRKLRNGKAVFAEWENLPSLSEIKQYTVWIKTHTADISDEDDEPAGNGETGASETGASGAPEPTESGGTLGDTPATQFWYVARGLIRSGVLSQEQVDEIKNRHVDQGTGEIDFLAAKAEIDDHIPVDG